MLLKIFFKSLILIGIISSSFAGEPGTVDEKIDIKEKIINEREENAPLLKKNIINLPKNPIFQLFNQVIGKKIDAKKTKIIGDCLPRQKLEFCKVVNPKSRSSHFNKYFYYLNYEKKVNAIIAFSDKRIGNVNKCRSMIKSWEKYFKNFDLLNITTDINKDQLFLEHINIKKTEISINCNFEQLRDIESYFSLKFFKK